MADHLGLIEMLSIFGIGIGLVAFELVRVSRAISRDQSKQSTAEKDERPPHPPVED